MDRPAEERLFLFYISSGSMIVCALAAAAIKPSASTAKDKTTTRDLLLPVSRKTPCICLQQSGRFRGNSVPTRR